jgi:hypothetical protein
MNIFFLHQDMHENAKMYVDKHVSKMRVEYAQLACFAHHYLRTPGVEPPYRNNKKHENHPSTKWVRESVANYMYVVEMGLILCEEMRHRHGTICQKTEQVLLYLKEHPIQVAKTKFTRPKLAMHEFIPTMACSRPIKSCVKMYTVFSKS